MKTMSSNTKIQLIKTLLFKYLIPVAPIVTVSREDVAMYSKRFYYPEALTVNHIWVTSAYMVKSLGNRDKRMGGPIYPIKVKNHILNKKTP